MKKYTERYKQLGLNIAFYRKMRSLTQDGLAEIVDISRTHLSNIEAGDKSPSLSVIFALAESLDVEVSKLFELR